MTRAALRVFLRALLRIFFRRIELAGLDRLPADGPAMLVANHPSTLVDPILLLAFAPRPVSFLAKEPVFRMPVIGRAARALDVDPGLPRHGRRRPAQATPRPSRGPGRCSGAAACWPSSRRGPRTTIRA